MISLLYLNQFYETEQGVGSSPKRNSCCIVSSRLSILLLCSHRTNRTRLRDELCAIGKLKEGVIRQRQRYRLHFFSCSHQQAGFLHGKGHLLTLLASFLQFKVTRPTVSCSMHFNIKICQIPEMCHILNYHQLQTLHGNKVKFN